MNAKQSLFLKQARPLFALIAILAVFLGVVGSGKVSPETLNAGSIFICVIDMSVVGFWAWKNKLFKKQ
jgi:hypothetical protein